MQKIILPTLLVALSFSLSAQEKSRVDQALVGQVNPAANAGDKKKKPSLADRSLILVSSGSWARVPKDSIINLPERFADRVVSSPPKGASHNRFIDFIKVNRGWIRTEEITFDQMKKMDVTLNKINENASNKGYVVIVTYNNNPLGIKRNLK